MSLGLSSIRSFLITACVYSFSSGQASVDNSWELKGGVKHPLFQTGESVDSLTNKVFNSNISFEERWRLVGQVAGLKSSEESFDFLKKCISSDEWFLQSAALKILSQKHPDKAVALAEVSLFNSKALVVRSEAVRVIEKLGGPEHAERLWKALNQRLNFNKRVSLWIRPQIVRSILKLETSKLSKHWNSLLLDSDKEIQAIAKEALKVI